MEIIDGDILDVRSGLICFQIPCQGFLHKGISKDISKKYPQVKIDFLKAASRNLLKLGNIVHTVIDDNLSIASYCGQPDYGMNQNTTYTDYQAVQKCFQGIKHIQILEGKQIFLPFYVGCGLGGAEWKFVYEYMGNILPKAKLMKLRRRVGFV